VILRISARIRGCGMRFSSIPSSRTPAFTEYRELEVYMTASLVQAPPHGDVSDQVHTVMSRAARIAHTRTGVRTSGTAVRT
jgi:hypothetical protein